MSDQRPAPRWRNAPAKTTGLVAVVAAVLATAVVLWRARPLHVDLDFSGPVAAWPHYGRDEGGTRYSSLDQITPENVRALRVAWTYHTGDLPEGHDRIPSETAFEATPILVAGLLVFPTPYSRVVALDPESGEERWSYDPAIDLTGHYANQLTGRGVEAWEDTTREGGPCRVRIFAATNDARLLALDAGTGRPCEGFGDSGQVDLSGGVGEEEWVGEYQVTSPPVAVGDRIVVGSAVADNVRMDAPSGVVRAYDARTGALVWAWDLAPPGGAPEPPGVTEAGYLRGSPNVWAPMSVDPERDLVFVPTGNPSPDYFGGLRQGSDYYGSSVVALQGSTGEVVWHFQTVHHDLWDYDVPAQPTLVTLRRNGVEIPALVQATKTGMLFVLNRETGEPVFGVEERPVPQSDVPGEQTSPTQPFPVLPPPLVPHDLSPDDAWGLTWLDRGACRESLAALRYEGIFTPPSLGPGTLAFPGNAGGSNWGGVAVDPERQVLIANVLNLAWSVALFPREELDRMVEEHGDREEIAPQRGTPYGLRRTMVTSSLGLPCNPPPWGSLAAVDLATGEIAWQVPLGTVRDIAPIPLPIRFGVPNLGGPVITASGVVFIAATMDDYLRAFDMKTGEELWKGRLPAGGQATPMTYRVRQDGRQYVVVAAGGHERGGTTLGDAVVAFALPE